MTEKINRSDAEWRQRLSDLEYKVTRQKGTERAFSGRYWKNKDEGTYLCVCCGNELFGSDAKYDSGTGWPSYWQPIRPDAVQTETDTSFLIKRTEVHCARCDAHLGHVFQDGPEPTGLRYCVNSASLRFKSKGEDRREE